MDIMIETRCLPIIVDLIYDHVIEQDGGLCDGNANLIGPASRVLVNFAVDLRVIHNTLLMLVA